LGDVRGRSGPPGGVHLDGRAHGRGLSLLWAWLPPFAGRRELLTFDGDAVRWAGVVLLCVGGVLRVWPMFTLGWRFSALVAIQDRHTLQTTGLYRFVRHPSYLGGIVWLVGWMLLFRSALGLVLLLPAWPLLRSRIAAEEAMLASVFGEEHARYRARSYRLVPFVY
jgi:protein-S-isoprenylcysteine O-methyltransferase Ste14